MSGTVYPGTNVHDPVDAEPIEWSISNHKRYEGAPAEIVTILGRRDLGWTSTSVLGDICQYLDTTQALMNTPVVGTTYYLNSTSAADAAAGTGARTVRIISLDSAGKQQVGTYTMNGTTAVSIGSGYTFFQWMEVASVGSSEVSAGDVTISSVNGVATVGTTMEFIKAGGNRSLSARYKIPTNKHALQIDWWAGAISATMDVRVRATVFADDRLLSTVYHFQDTRYLSTGENSDGHAHYIRYPAGCIVKASAIPGSAPAGNRCDINIHLALLDGD
jgi:hypothetical protein